LFCETNIMSSFNTFELCEEKHDSDTYFLKNPFVNFMHDLVLNLENDIQKRIAQEMLHCSNNVIKAIIYDDIIFQQFLKADKLMWHHNPNFLTNASDKIINAYFEILWTYD
jgi:hypothetical protein